MTDHNALCWAATALIRELVTMAAKNIDRKAIVPPDTGDTILPNSPFFSRLVRFAHDEPPPLAVRDVNLNMEKTYLQLLTDVLAVRNRLRDTLPSKTLREITQGIDTFIGVLAPGGYEYTVAVLAVLALGAAVVPMSIPSQSLPA